MSYKAGNKDFHKLEDNVDYLQVSGMVAVKGSPKYLSPFDIKVFHHSLYSISGSYTKKYFKGKPILSPKTIIRISFSTN